MADLPGWTLEATLPTVGQIDEQIDTDPAAVVESRLAGQLTSSCDTLFPGRASSTALATVLIIQLKIDALTTTVV